MKSEHPTDILAADHRYGLLAPGDKVLVAVSGGPDSVVLLHALHTCSNRLGITLHVAHLNHGIRAEASDLDEEFVRSLAQEFGLPVTVERMDVPALRQQMRMGMEEAARDLRYEFLQRSAREIGAQKIAVGHNADDRVESVLFNIIRGTGIDGLGSIRPVRGNIVRPLIDTPRSEIEAYIDENALPFRIDESNQDVSYSRNRIRHELLPLLERDYNPQIREALIRLAGIASDQSDLMEVVTQSALRAVTFRGSIDATFLLDLPSALGYELIRSELMRLKGDLKDVSFEQIDRVLQALRAGDDFTITLPSGSLYAERRGMQFRLREAETIPEVMFFDHQIAVPGTTAIPEIGITITSRLSDYAAPGKTSPDEAFIDAGAIAGALRVRNLEPGDRIIPFGMKVRKKLQDVFVDKKIPRAQRAKAAVVTDDEKVLWVVGIVTSEAARVTGSTAQVVHLVCQGTSN